MEDQICELQGLDGMLDLGMILGQNQAFGFIGGRCSAAQAESLCRLRNEKLYKRVTEHWRDFCPLYLKLSASQADRIIHLWEEFGAGYFELSQITRVSAETYRAIEPSVSEGVLNLNGRQIALTMKNARKVADAVAEVRRALPPKVADESSIPDRLDRLEQLCGALTEEFRAIPDISGDFFDRYRMALMNLYNVLRNLRKQFHY